MTFLRNLVFLALAITPPISVSQIQGITVFINGQKVGTEPSINLNSGSGIIQTCTDNLASKQIVCTPSFNNTTIATLSVIESGSPQFCNSSNGTTQFTCNLPYPVPNYSTGMFVLLHIDTNANACTLNISGIGIKAIKQNDGATDPVGLLAGHFYWVFYDGVIFRLV